MIVIPETGRMSDREQHDEAARTITFHRTMPEAQPGDIDFPELRRDVHNNPLTEEVKVPMIGTPPAWLVAAEAHPRAA